MKLSSSCSEKKASKETTAAESYPEGKASIKRNTKEVNKSERKQEKKEKALRKKTQETQSD